MLFKAGMGRVGRKTAAMKVVLPIFPDLNIVVDHSLLNTSCYIVSQTAPALALGEGPTESAKYRDEPRGYVAFIIRQWLQPRLVLAGAVREITGVHA